MDKPCAKDIEKETRCRSPIYIYKNIREKKTVDKLGTEILLVTWAEFITWNALLLFYFRRRRCHTYSVHYGMSLLT